MYQVLWRTPLLDRLAELYVAVDPVERDRMAAGVSAFNARLAADPLNVGESRSADGRIAFPPLLLVYFYVDPYRRRVEVMRVNRYGA